MPIFVKYFPEYKYVKVEELWRAVNNVERTLIRTEADEVTYNLHIMLRYEIEKALFSNEITVDDLPEIWNSKTKEYLGIVPKDYATGVLQDIHWAQNSFGYFPSYMMGNLYSAQFYHAMKKEIDVDKAVRDGELDKVLAWLRKNIHQYGRLYNPSELVEKATGEKLNPKYFKNYIEQKYINYNLMQNLVALLKFRS